MLGKLAPLILLLAGLDNVVFVSLLRLGSGCSLLFSIHLVLNLARVQILVIFESDPALA